jgi:hypothetical protein
MRTSRILLVAVAATLAACASTPSSPRPVAVKAGEISRDYSSFNARVLSEAGEIDHAFTASLDPEAEPVTRLQSAYTHDLGDGEKLRIGDAVSSAGMWGSSVRYGGVQFGTRTGARDDVIANTEFASEGLAVLPTASDALLAAAGDSAATSVSAERSWRTGALTASDVRGRSVSIDGPIIAETRLVEQGCADFAVGAGKVRRDYAILSNEYGPVFANATVACSAPLGFTVEGHGEYLADDVAALGFGLARRVGALGTASFAMAQSRAVAGEEGWLARVGFEHRNDLFKADAESRIPRGRCARAHRPDHAARPREPRRERHEARESVARLCDADDLERDADEPHRRPAEPRRGPRLAVDERRALARGQLRLLSFHLLQAPARRREAARALEDRGVRSGSPR